MALYNNIIACSNLASTRINEFNFSCQYPSTVVLPKSVSLSKAVICNSLMTFKANQRSIYINVDNSSDIQEFVITNGYFDTVAELLSTINALPGLSAVGITFSYSIATESIKITKSINTNVQFTIKSLQYNNSSNVCRRLGFNMTQDYGSYLEGGNQVVYATSPVKLIRTNGFFLASNICTVPTATPGNVCNIIDFIPIESASLKYGDLIVLDRTNISKNIPVFRDQQQRNMIANSEFSFQLLDDEFEAITDTDKGLNTILFLNADYD